MWTEKTLKSWTTEWNASWRVDNQRALSMPSPAVTHFSTLWDKVLKWKHSQLRIHEDSILLSVCPSVSKDLLDFKKNNFRFTGNWCREFP